MEWNSLTMEMVIGSWNTPHKPMRRNITVAPSSRALRTPIFFMMIGTTPVHFGLKEDLETVQGAVGGVADFFSGEDGVVGREHLLIEHGVEGVGQQHEDDEHPRVGILRTATISLRTGWWGLRSGRFPS